MHLCNAHPLRPGLSEPSHRCRQLLAFQAINAAREAGQFRVLMGTPPEQVDLVARRGAILAFVEVKARATVEAGLAAVDAGTWRRIEAAADLYLARHPEFAGLTLRFDLVAVSPRRWPRHGENASS